MEIEASDVGMVTVLRPLAKKIDAGKSAQFIEKFDEHLEDGYRFIALNLSLVDFVDTSGLNAIIAEYKKIMSMNGILVFFGCKPSVMNQLRLTGLTNYFKVFTTQEQAVEYLEAQIKGE